MNGVVLIGHGSKVQAAEKDMELVAEALRRTLNNTILETSYLSLTPPPFEDAVTKCVEAGAKVIIVIPYMLSMGAHVMRDIPEMIRRESEKHAGVTIICGDYLSFDYGIVESVRSRIVATLCSDGIPRAAELMAGQRLAVLATTDIETQSSYTSLVGYVPMDGIKRILFATSHDSRKFRNLVANPRVSMLIDNRNQSTDVFFNAEAITVIGTAREVTSGAKETFLRHFLDRHPQLESFVREPSCALICVDVEKMFHVSRFQNVTELKPE